MIEVCISEEKEEGFVYIEEELLGVPEKALVSIRFYSGHFKLLPLIFLYRSKIGNVTELKRLLERVNLQTRVSFR